MNKLYKHKTLGWIAKENYSCYYIEGKANTGTMHPCPAKIPKELIEGSSDREEVVEKKIEQWMIDVIEEYNRNYTHLNDHKLITALEKHAPKQVKFTKDDVKIRKNGKDIISLQNMTLTEIICMFLDDHNIFDTKTE